MSGSDPPRSPRIIRRPRTPGGEGISWSSLRPAELWATLRSYIGLGSAVRHESIADPDSLARFLEGRASFVAQTSLYGYLRTRAGMRYPELFQDDVFLESINIAKWHVWLDCLSDVAVYAGGRLARDEPRQVPRIARLMATALDQILARAGTPPEAGDEFPAHAERVRQRIARTDWLSTGPDDAAFTESPAGLVRWAPVLDELKQLDEEIVRNSVRFRWLEVRRDFALRLDMQAMLSSMPGKPSS